MIILTACYIAAVLGIAAWAWRRLSDVPRRIRGAVLATLASTFVLLWVGVIGGLPGPLLLVLFGTGLVAALGNYVLPYALASGPRVQIPPGATVRRGSMAELLGQLNAAATAAAPSPQAEAAASPWIPFAPPPGRGGPVLEEPPTVAALRADVEDLRETLLDQAQEIVAQAEATQAVGEVVADAIPMLTRLRNGGLQ